MQPIPQPHTHTGTHPRKHTNTLPRARRYPFEPPRVRFTTPVYHPNIDSEGRICLDTLNMPPKGAWRPSLNVATVLATVALLLAEPNPDDGLMPELVGGC